MGEIEQKSREGRTIQQDDGNGMDRQEHNSQSYE